MGLSTKDFFSLVICFFYCASAGRRVAGRRVAGPAVLGGEADPGAGRAGHARRRKAHGGQTEGTAPGMIRVTKMRRKTGDRNYIRVRCCREFIGLLSISEAGTTTCVATYPNQQEANKKLAHQQYANVRILPSVAERSWKEYGYLVRPAQQQ